MASFQQPSYSTTEGNSVQVCAALFPEADIQVSVSFIISGGTAQLATDFTLSPSTQVLIFEAGSTLSCVTVAATNDSLLEEDEDFTLILQSSNMFVGISSIVGSTVVTIPNQNSKIASIYCCLAIFSSKCLIVPILFLTAVTVTFQEPSYTMEEGSSGQVCGELSSTAAIPVTVSLSITGGTALESVDFTIPSPSIIFQAGSVLSCVDVMIANDSLLEESETFTLALNSSNPVVQTSGTATVTIPNRNSTQNSLF